MCLFEDFLIELYEFLTKSRNIAHNNIIRRHTKKLQQLGDLSFPLTLQNWHKFIDVKTNQIELITIFDYALGKNDINYQIEELINTSNHWNLQIDRIEIKNDDVYIFLDKETVYRNCIRSVVDSKENFGAIDKYFNKLIIIETDNDIIDDKHDLNLTELRAIIIRNITGNILKYLTINEAEHDETIKITLKSNRKTNNTILCGSVLNDNGIKDTTTTSNDLYKKRSIDIQLMAQHKYGIRCSNDLREYFDRLARNSVIIEMLQNRPQKNIKITLNNPQTTNREACFIFYNCARLAALLKEFENKEEWEIMFVYIVQFPLLIKNCVNLIKNGVINPHYLIVYLSNLSSIFSVYYRRIKILTVAKDHLFATLFARIYLLKSLQYVFHCALNLLDIPPITEM